MWSLEAIADLAVNALAARDDELRNEQAVRGLDALDELTLHPLIAGAFQRAGFGVLREQPYPHEWTRKVRPLSPDAAGVLPIRRDRQRCDIVLTPEPAQVLHDALQSERARREERLEISGTLFESAIPAPVPLPRPDAVSPEDAFWIEVKVVGQYTLAGHVLGVNRSYSSDLIRAGLSDLSKLAADERIRAGCLLLVLFTADQATAVHDLAVMARRCLDKALPIESPAVRHFRIPDRLGNTNCSVSVLGFRRHG